MASGKFIETRRCFVVLFVLSLNSFLPLDTAKSLFWSLTGKSRVRLGFIVYFILETILLKIASVRAEGAVFFSNIL